MPICIFNHKSDLFLSVPKQSAFFAVADPGEGGLVQSGPIRRDACLRPKFFNRRDRTSLFNWLTFLMKHAIAFCR